MQSEVHDNNPIRSAPKHFNRRINQIIDLGIAIVQYRKNIENKFPRNNVASSLRGLPPLANW